jgi:peroxiredoxin
MNKLLRSVLFYLVVAAAFGHTARSHGPDDKGSFSQPDVDVGARVSIEKLTLASVDGSLHSFQDLLGDGQAVCYTFLYPGCPLAQIYCPVLNSLAAEFGKQGVTIVGVICESEAINDLEAHKKEFSIEFPILLDTKFDVATLLDATMTPESFLVSRDGTVAYAGRIDSRYREREVAGASP